MNENNQTEKMMMLNAWDSYVSKNSLMFVSSTIPDIVKQTFFAGWIAGQASVVKLSTITTT